MVVYLQVKTKTPGKTAPVCKLFGHEEPERKRTDVAEKLSKKEKARETTSFAAMVPLYNALTLPSQNTGDETVNTTEGVPLAQSTSGAQTFSADCPASPEHRQIKEPSVNMSLNQDISPAFTAALDADDSLVTDNKKKRESAEESVSHQHIATAGDSSEGKDDVCRQSESSTDTYTDNKNDTKNDQSGVSVQPIETQPRSSEVKQEISQQQTSISTHTGIDASVRDTVNQKIDELCQILGVETPNSKYFFKRNINRLY